MMDANQLLMGSGIKSIKWKDHQIGHTVIGTICEPPKVEQMKKYQSDELDFWPSGDPKMQIIVTLQTELRDDGEDDGRRRLYIEPRMMTCVRNAVKAAGAKGLEVGGRLAIRWISGTGQGEGNARQFAAEYAAPVVDPGSLLNGGSQPQQQAPAQAAPTSPAGPTGSGGLLNTPTTPAQAPAGPPPGVDPQVWDTLPDAQRQAVLAAMGTPAAGGDAFAPSTPF
ncbi:hypothetical protein [Mycolicibacterium sp.]|uniref:hypothetical protein n=1 Tax=Mycolicibacterium sp. TaxID=2320850 RepID=UPI003560BA28